MKDKSTLYALIAIIMIVLITGVAFTFAYIGKPTNTGNTNLNTTIQNITNDISMEITGSTALTLNVTLDKLGMDKANNDYSSYITGNNSTFSIKLNTTASVFAKGASCAYSIIYTPTKAYTASSGATNANLKELVISGSNGTNSINDYSIAGKTSAVTIYNGSIATSSSSASVTQNWTVVMKFFNLNVDQGGAIGQSPSGKITVQSGACTVNS